MSARILSSQSDVSPVTLSRILNGKQTPDTQTVVKLAAALEYPVEFFEQGDLDLIDAEAASFRSLTAMTATERDAALAAGSLAYELADWVNARFRLPDPDIPDLGHEQSADVAARMLRKHWNLGERPIGHLIKFLEAKGIRVFSLAENTRNVDAFSCWRNGEPFIFLNTFKTAERTRFDAAHELGHLVLHRHGGPNQRTAEAEANLFASEFLMPGADVISSLPRVSVLKDLINAKRRWGVSASALAYKLHKLSLISDWVYRSFMIQLNQNFHEMEPSEIDREFSSIWQAVLSELWKEGISREKIARDLRVPLHELDNLIFGLTEVAQKPVNTTGDRKLRLVM
jgi:Zn-dependent peptidase ImmA (M78 family)/plasmid maintenance system antidote protein VapI